MVCVSKHGQEAENGLICERVKILVDKKKKHWLDF